MSMSMRVSVDAFVTVCAHVQAGADFASDVSALHVAEASAGVYLVHTHTHTHTHTHAHTHTQTLRQMSVRYT